MGGAQVESHGADAVAVREWIGPDVLPSSLAVGLGAGARYLPLMTKVYAYSGCGTCRTALKFLKTHGVAHGSVPVREQPPTMAELRKMLAFQGGAVRRLFNTSGADYRALGLASTLSAMSPDAALDLLATNGNLVKRPFLLTADGGTVGFDENVWRELLGIQG